MDYGATLCVKVVGVDTQRIGSRVDVPSAGIGSQRDRRKSKLRDKHSDHVDDIGVCTPVSDGVCSHRVNVDFEMVSPHFEWWRSDH